MNKITYTIKNFKAQYLLALQVSQRDTSFPTVNCAIAGVWPISLIKESSIQGKEKQNSQYKPQNITIRIYHSRNKKVVLPSRPMGEFSLRKCDKVDAYVKRFNTCYNTTMSVHELTTRFYLIEMLKSKTLTT